jgi:putative aldouronate transport system substrate-binding protein
MNYFAAPFGSEEYQLINYGVEGVDFDFDDRGNPVLTQRGQAEQTISVGWQYLTLPLPVLFNPNDANFVKATYEDEQAMVPVLVQDPSIGLYSETDISMTSQLTRPFFDGIGEIVTGRRPLSDYDQLVSAWRSSGGEQMRSEFQAAYAEAGGAAR